MRPSGRFTRIPSMRRIAHQSKHYHRIHATAAEQRNPPTWEERSQELSAEEGGEGTSGFLPGAWASSSLGSSSRLEGKGLEPLMIHPRAKKEMPARMAVPQAWEYHLLYCRMANLHWSLRVAASGFTASGGLG
ncbi:hypothetical protein EJ110_NYTH52449 [Nymphaea thermarum]|nr:hypothetical protein EJ110_NYTH52449 [Nymphaea thermarum]